MDGNLTGKTPISILQEICTKRGVTPQYDLIANEGAVHEPVFSFRVVAGEFSATGSGSSKKKAKHNAAQAILSKILGCPAGEAPQISNPAIPSPPVAQDDGIAGNPVGELQEFTQKRLLRPPIFEFATEQGPPHARQFICIVKLGKFIEKGEGKSKKLAKRKAANQMLTKLTSEAIPQEEIECAEENEEVNVAAASDYSSLKEGRRVKTLSPSDSKQIGQFYAKLKASPGKKLAALQTLKLNSGQDFIRMLMEISEEQRFETSYISLPEISISGHHQVLVQLATMPVAVCHGAGVDADQAKTQAAHNALQYLKIMTRKV